MCKKIFSVFCVGFLCLNVLCCAKTEELAIAPDFEVELLDGTTTSLYELTAKGKPVFVNFWATWCPPCRAELPDLNEFAVKQKALGDDAEMEFIAICISDTKEEWKSFIKENGYSFKTGIDEDGESAEKYFVEGIPASFIISSDNKILKTTTGMLSKDALDEFVNLN